MNKGYLTTFILIIITHALIGQNLIINEFCASNSLYNDEDNDTPDWIEIYNNSSESINLSSYYISDDVSLLSKWNLPDFNIAPNQPLLVFASGKDRSNLSNYSSLIKQGDSFSYQIGTSSIPAEWKNLGFDDSAWDKGNSGFGYGDNDDATVFPENTLSIFVRKTFELSDISNISELLFHIDYDDGFVAYINGQEIGRANLGVANTEVPFDQTADTYIEPLMSQGLPPEQFIISNFKDIIIDGTNVLSIQIHNQSIGSSDLTLIPFLTLNNIIPIGGASVPEVLNLPSQSLHSNFKISANGERLFLSDNAGTIIDQVDSISLLPDISYGRLASNIQKWVYFATPTPSEVNGDIGYENIGSDPVQFSLEGGKYGSSQQITLSNSSGGKIYYTSDGTVPTENSTAYSNPISINRTTVVKALVIDNNSLSVTPTAQTYIIETRSFSIPIVSISMNPDDLWDWNTGIYVKGPNAESNYPYFGANFWMDWEKQMYFEYFDENGTKLYGAPGGVKIFGGWSRGSDQKSMALFARKAYGVESFDYKFFEEKPMDSYKSLVLRNGGNDNGNAKIRDPFMTSLLEGVDVDRQAYQPTAVYLNGEYWGILSLREKVNENFLENNHNGVKASEVDILENEGNAIEGTNDHYLQMLEYIEKSNIENSTVFDSVCKLMDVENFIEYQLAQIYYDNQDWPGNNIKFWKPQSTNGKWRWIIYDTDFGYGIYNDEGYKQNTLDFAMYEFGSGWPNPAWSTYLLRTLMENETFKARFVNRFADRLNQNFNSQDVVIILDDMKYEIESELSFHNSKWDNMWGFEENMSVMETFAFERPYYMRTHISSTLSQGGVADLTVDVSDTDAGNVQVNILAPQEYPWKGKYFKNTPVLVQANANPGYVFSYWDGINSSEPSIEVSVPTGGISLKAVFKSTTNEYSTIVINEINYNSDDNFDCGDWIELYNTSESDIDISNWVISDGEDEQVFTIPTGSKITKNNYLVICRDREKFAEFYPNVENVVGDVAFGLASLSDMVLLYNSNNIISDSVLYLNENPWPKINSNQTIALIKPRTDNSKGYNWDESIGNGTPGTHNDYYTKIPDTDNVSSEIIAYNYPNPMNDITTIVWENNIRQNVIVDVYDINGRLINQIYNSSCSEGLHEVIWQPSDNNESGVYFVQIELENGLQKTLKLIKY